MQMTAGSAADRPRHRAHARCRNDRDRFHTLSASLPSEGPGPPALAASPNGQTGGQSAR